MSAPPINPKFEKKRAWIGILGTKIDEKEARKDYERVRKNLEKEGGTDDPRRLPKLLDRGQLDKARRAILASKLDIIESKEELVEQACDNTVRKKVKAAADEARTAFKNDLGVTENNQEAIAAIDDATKVVDEALDGVTPGLGDFYKTMEAFSKSSDYTTAVTKDPTVTDGFQAIWEKGAGDGNQPGDPPGALKDLAQLQTKCETINEGLEEHKQRQQRRQDRLDRYRDGDVKTKLADPQTGQSIKDRLNALMISAQKSVDACVKDPSQAATANSLINEVKALLEEVDDDPAAAETKSKFIKPYKYITEYFADAKKFNDDPSCTSPVGDLDKQKKTADRHNTEAKYLDRHVEQAEKLKETIAELLKQAQVAWKQALKDNGPAIRFLKNLAAANAPPEEVDVPDQRSKERKKAEQKAQAALADYEAAQAHAGKMEFVDAIAKLQLAAAEGQKLEKVAGKEREKVVNDTTEAEQSEKEAFNILVYRPDDRNFDTNRDALHYMTGQVFDPEDGALETSPELRKMYAAQAAALKRWHALTDKGVDPISAGETAFKNIPPNFWPPEAVRAVAMYRKAVASFEEEERVKELEQTLAGKALDKSADILNDQRTQMTIDAISSTSDTIQQVMQENIQKEHPDWSNSQVSTELSKQVKNTDIGKAAEGLADFATAMGLLTSVVKIGKDIKELVGKQSEIGEEKINPVAEKIAEFERNRAIMHLVLDFGDLLTGVAGALNDVLPGLGIAGDAKTFVQSIMEAGRYFKMLYEASQLKEGAKKDPETMMHLALAKEVKDTRLFGFQKAFDTAIALAKVVGGAAELAGPAAPAGFAIKKGAIVLNYCGKGLFQVHAWNEASSCKSALAAAKKQPVDYLAVEAVFKESRKFARFALAWGCVEGNDPWARQHVLGRGLTDSDLDNPETTHTIVREYLNVTFEGLSGDTQEDEERGKTFKESIPFIGKKFSKEKGPPPHEVLTKTPDIEKLKEEDPIAYQNNVYDDGAWVPTDSDLSETSWATNFEGAVAAGMYNDKKVLKAVKAGLAEYTVAYNAANDASVEYKETAKGFMAKTPTKTRDEFLEVLEETRELFQKLDAELRYLHQQLGAFQPSSRDRKKIHKGGHLYQKNLLEEIATGLAETTENLNLLQEHQFGLGRTREEAQQEARGQFEQVDNDFQQKLEEFRDEAERLFKEAWEAADFKLPWGGKAKLLDLAAVANTKFNLQAPDDQNLADALEKASEDTYNLTLILLTSPQMKYLNPPPNDQPQKLKDKMEKERLKTMKYEIDVRSKFAVKSVEEKLAELCATAVGEPQTLSFNLVTPEKLEVSVWHQNITLGEQNGWARKNTGIGECLTTFQNADAAWQAVKGDIYTQTDWRTIHAELEKKIKTWKPMTVDGIAHPVMAKYRGILIKEASKARGKFEKEKESAEKPATGTGGVWAPSKNDFKKFPLTPAGWKSFEALAVRHGWKKNSPSSTTKRFEEQAKAAAEHKSLNSDDSKAAYKTALTKLQSKLGEFKAKHFVTKDSKDVKFEAVENFVEAMKDLVADELNALA